jgi:site-specific DNA recombinase
VKRNKTQKKYMSTKNKREVKETKAAVTGAIQLSEGPIRVGLWARYGSISAAEGCSVRKQEVKCLEYAAAHEWEVVELYSPEGVSGGNVLNHSEAQRMMADIERKHIDGVVAYEFTDFSTTPRGLSRLLEFFKKHEAAVVIVSNSFNSLKPAGILMIHMLAAMEEWEREARRARIIERLNHKHKKQ